jgi:hypothetical protein
MLIGIAPHLARPLEQRLEELGHVVLHVAHVHAAVVRIQVTKPELVLVPLDDLGRDLPTLQGAIDEVNAHIVAVPREDPLMALNLYLAAARAFGS